jgi:hypothetical protein
MENGMEKTYKQKPKPNQISGTLIVIVTFTSQQVDSYPVVLIKVELFIYYMDYNAVNWRLSKETV